MWPLARCCGRSRIFLTGAHEPDGGVAYELDEGAVGALVLAGDVDADAEVGLDELVFEGVGLVEKGFDVGEIGGASTVRVEAGLEFGGFEAEVVEAAEGVDFRVLW